MPGMFVSDDEQMSLTSLVKELRIWIYFEIPNLPRTLLMSPGSLMESTNGVSTSGRPPLPPSAQARALLLKAASSFKDKSPSIFRNLSADGSRIYESIMAPPPEKNLRRPSFLLSSQDLVAEPSTPTESDSSPPPRQPPSPPLTPRQSQNLTVKIPPPHHQPRTPLPPVPPPSPPLTPLTPKTPRQPIIPSVRKGGRSCICSGRCVPDESVNVWDQVFYDGGNTDVAVYVNDGSRIDAHSVILMASSPVFRSILEDRVGGGRVCAINFSGVPFHAACCFLRFIYSSRFEHADMEKYALHLVVLAHAYMIPALKRVCTEKYDRGLLNSENVVDVLQVARLCDAPRLHLLCLRRIVSDFKSVARSEGWSAMKESDPALEQELVEAVIEADTKKQERVRKLEEDKVYEQLHDAMQALVHICTDGCRSIGPHDKALDGKQGSCPYPACKGLESLVRHFAGCKQKVSGGCVHCKRMWQLLELHSRMCTAETCKVPLCRHFKERGGQQLGKKDENRWKMLVRKVQSAKTAASAFSLADVSARLEQVV